MSTRWPDIDPGLRWRDLGKHSQSQWHGFEHNGGRQSVSRLEQFDKWGALIGGSALAAFGISRRSWFGLGLAGAGGYLVFHGVRSLRGAVKPVNVRVAFTINKPVEEVWRFWRTLENLPRFMTHLESVQPTSNRYSYWTTRTLMGQKLTWHAELTDERENEYLVWESLPGSDVHHRGSVQFRRAPGDRGTEIHVALDYIPPAGQLGAAVASLFGESGEQQVREDLRHLKQLLETGEIPSTEGQPHGRRSLAVKAAQRAWREPQERLDIRRSA